jgi:hypothetical protein
LEKPKKMNYLDFYSMPSREMNGRFILTLKHNTEKIICEASWKNGLLIGVFKDYAAWGYVSYFDEDLIKELPLYKLNPITNIGYFCEQEIQEGESIVFKYDEELFD